MQTLNISVPAENIQQIAQTVKTELMADLTKFLTDNAPKKYISADEVCERFGITKPTIHEYRRRGIIKSYKLGARVYYRWDEIENAMIINH